MIGTIDNIAGFNHIESVGDIDILKTHKLSIFCSAKCPGDLILQAFDTAKALRNTGVTVVGSFHTPIERELLKIFLRGKQHIIICPARSIEGWRMPKEYAKPIKDGRLLILSCIDSKHKRITAETSRIRNEFVATLADKILIVHASKGSKTETLCEYLIGQGHSIHTFQSPYNKHLLEAGAKIFKTESIIDMFLEKKS